MSGKLATEARTELVKGASSGIGAATARALGELGWDWDRNLIKQILESWEHWGVLQHHHYLPAERVAEAVVTAVMAPAGTRLDVIQLNPEAPKEARRARDE